MPDAPSPASIDVRNERVRACIDRYWRRNLRTMAALLVVWAVVGPGCGVLFADSLNEIRVGGFRLGFWFAQQGSIATFVLLILIYAVVMNRLDRQHRAELDALREDRGPA
ncbi:MAG: DUF4212 domain-containing protein [Planctomycetota bacterium]